MLPAGASSPIPVIDLFAGPGGLGEGFAACPGPSGRPAFRIHLSIEKEASAYSTLLLRSFFRQFDRAAIPEEYYDYLRGVLSRDELFERFPNEVEAAGREAWQAELGVVDHHVVQDRITEALGPNPDDWVLIGGPPCQAYSVAGRVRIRGEYRKRQQAEIDAGSRRTLDPDAAFDADSRHFLYREYLQIIADHRPSVFVMENVPGLLSARVAGKPMVDLILRDLRDPLAAVGNKQSSGAHPLRYRLSALTPNGDRDLIGNPSADVRSFIVDAAEHGVPQARKRVLIVGVRDDIEGHPRPLAPRPQVTVRTALSDLPPLRSRLSREPDAPESWVSAILALREQPWYSALDSKVRSRLSNGLGRVRRAGLTNPTSSCAPSPPPDDDSEFTLWCRDARMECTCNHEARAHMRTDLWRYQFAVAYAKVTNLSPILDNFPAELLPDHASALKARNGREIPFKDRFRVQVPDRPSTTIVSHIARDGHYYIHYNPAQCRSLTVREAARLQSFPDNYLFEGNRTQQYTQVGNAVPPLLALQVAASVYAFMAGSALPEGRQYSDLLARLVNDD